MCFVLAGCGRRMKNTGVGAERLSFDGDGAVGHRVLVGME